MKYIVDLGEGAAPLVTEDESKAFDTATSLGGNADCAPLYRTDGLVLERFVVDGESGIWREVTYRTAPTPSFPVRILEAAR